MDTNKWIEEEIRVSEVLDAAVRMVGTGYRDSRDQQGDAQSEDTVSEDGHAYIITVQAVDIGPEGEVII